MAAKALPKYPKRSNVVRRRFLTQALVLLGVAAAVFFYFSMHDKEEQPGTLQQFGASLVSERQPEESAQPGERAAPPSARPADRSSPGRQAAQPDTTSAPEAASSTVPFPLAAQTLPRDPAPYGNQELAILTARLANRYANATPAIWGERMPGITSRLFEANILDAPKVLALTLDACGGKKGASYDEELIHFLRAQQIPATLFMTTVWIKNNPQTFLELAADPLFEIACHGTRHRPCSINGKSVYGIEGTASLAELLQEVELNAREITKRSGTRPRWFRSGTAYYDDVAVKVIADLGMGVAGYTIAADEGATLSATRVALKVRAARPGDIILCHMNKPLSGTREGLMRALPELKRQGFNFVRMSEMYAPQ